MQVKYYRFFILFFIVLFADQISKWWIMHHFFDQDTYFSLTSWIFNFSLERVPFETIKVLENLNIVSVWNKGVSFGILANDHPITPHILSLISLAIVGFFGFMFKNTHKVIQHYAIALIIGGALGNIFDRIRFEAVYDFIDFHIGEWHYPAFNVADSSITLGIILYIIGDFMTQRPKRNKFVKKVGRWHAK